MNILISSKSFVIREYLHQLFIQIYQDTSIQTTTDLKKLDLKNLQKIDFLLVDLKEKTEENLKIISYLKYKIKDLKVLIVDRKNSNQTLKKSLQLGLDGYIHEFTDKEEFIFNINKILKGKKVYDSQKLQSLISQENVPSQEVLTKREKEVLKELGKGLNNKEISDNLYITESTVKKHVSSILQKLSLKNRQEAIIYINNNLR